ncbi:hypothetical protein [Halomonas sp. BC04]|uniref:hypothetical protein n=1 Tax=Halomonas sp. BC04 TaxID=1403540 RepID=UPI0003ED6855|nr:hypothetical protein Q427_07540 [Halomonas sp. BC04]
MADASQLSAHLDAQRQAFDAERYPSLAVRRDRLRRLGDMTRHIVRTSSRRFDRTSAIDPRPRLA